MDIPWASIITGATAVASAGAAFGAWKTSREAHGTAREAHATADAVARIEQARWHADLTPVFEAHFDRTTGNLNLEVTLVGPQPLEHLDEVAISILQSDYRSRFAQHAGARDPADIEAHTWGPYRFVPRLDGIDENGQHADPVRMPVGRGNMYAMEKTRKPIWDEGDNGQWWSQWAGRPVRLLLHCRKDGIDAPWTVPLDVPQPE